ncbi:MAG TPA: TetR/AcrR family transcriptional regulator [Polyangia bacterium]
MARPPQHESKEKILDAAMHVIRQKGYDATTVDDICAEAGLTKGSFFHHFASKEELALATADHFAKMAAGLFAHAPFRDAGDPRERLLAYVDLRAQMAHGELPEFTCLLGTMAQEVYETHPAIRKACGRHIGEHAATVEKDIVEAKRRYAPKAKWSAESLALFTQAVIQGAFVLAKAKNDDRVAAECIGHLRRYLEMLLPPS